MCQIRKLKTFDITLLSSMIEIIILDLYLEHELVSSYAPHLIHKPIIHQCSHLESIYNNGSILLPKQTKPPYDKKGK